MLKFGLWAVSVICLQCSQLTLSTQVENLHTLLGEVESWACQLYPQHTFDDLVSQLEELGNHSAVQVFNTCYVSIHNHFHLIHIQLIHILSVVTNFTRTVHLLYRIH